MYVCIYIYMHLDTYIYIYIYLHTYACICIYTYIVYIVCIYYLSGGAKGAEARVSDVAL